jgi:hypothetical protein
MSKYTEMIDRYLSGQMSIDEQRAFEQELKTNGELRAEYELQRQVMKGVQRYGMKGAAKKGIKQASFKSNLLKWGTTFLVVAAAAVFVWVAKDKLFGSEKNNIRYELNEENKKEWADADKNLAPQVFEIRADKDTVIETSGGIVIAIPAGAFSDKNGAGVQGKVEIEVKEALTPGDIIKGGLSTMSDGRLLETGGMFYFNARQNGTSLVVTKNKSINVNVPTDEKRAGMMLFEGQRMDNGQINWKNPKPLDNNLTTVDILSLNFYPPHFLDTLRAFGFDITNKALTDSIYYSLSLHGYQHRPAADSISRKQLEADARRIADSLAAAINLAITQALSDTSKSLDEELSESKAHGEGTDLAYWHSEGGNYEIDPSRIHAIWDRQFNNTILATKEFEERLQVIFQTCDKEILEGYVGNLDKKLYEIDSMVCQWRNGAFREQFRRFYERRDGGVSIKAEYLKKLNAYFEEKQRLYKEAALATLRKMYAAENQETERSSERQRTHGQTEQTREQKILNEEINANLKEAYRQLGKPFVPSRPPAPAYYGASVTTMGWKNVDAYVVESAVSRTTLDYTEPQTGNKAVISYEPLEVKVAENEQYERVFVYLLPDKLSSFQRVKEMGAGIFKEKLNGTFSYDLVVLGFKGSDAYFKQVASVRPGKVDVTLSATSQLDLDALIKRFSFSQRETDFTKELKFQAMDQKELIRQKAIQKREEITRRLRQVIYPCINSGAQSPAEGMVNSPSGVSNNF